MFNADRRERREGGWRILQPQQVVDGSTDRAARRAEGGGDGVHRRRRSLICKVLGHGQLPIRRVIASLCQLDDAVTSLPIPTAPLISFTSHFGNLWMRLLIGRFHHVSLDNGQRRQARA